MIRRMPRRPWPYTGHRSLADVMRTEALAAKSMRPVTLDLRFAPASGSSARAEAAEPGFTSRPGSVCFPSRAAARPRVLARCVRSVCLCLPRLPRHGRNHDAGSFPNAGIFIPETGKADVVHL